MHPATSKSRLIGATINVKPTIDIPSGQQVLIDYGYKVTSSGHKCYKMSSYRETSIVFHRKG